MNTSNRGAAAPCEALSFTERSGVKTATSQALLAGTEVFCVPISAEKYFAQKKDESMIFWITGTFLNDPCQNMDRSRTKV